MKLSVFKRLTSIILSFIIIFFVTSATASAMEMPSNLDEGRNDFFNNIEVARDQVPEIIAKEVVQANNNAHRLYDQELNLNTALFANTDGSETLYYFEYPIKYVDAAGFVQDKSNELFSAKIIDNNYSYINSRNDINTLFPTYLSSNVGVQLRTQSGKIQLSPETIYISEVDKQKNTIIYNEPFGEFTQLRYTPSFTGFKEDLILQQNIGNEFTFIISTNDYRVSELYGQVIFTSLTTDETIIMEPVYAYDSFEGTPPEEADDYTHNTWNNSIDIVQLNDGKYKVTISIDPSFLADERTVYPVYIDPSFNVTTSGNGTSKTIQDVPIYSGTDLRSFTAGYNTNNILGYAGTMNGKNYGVGRMLMKFPGLTSNPTYKKLPIDSISNVTLYITESSTNSHVSTLYAYQYTGMTWAEPSATYNNTTWSGYTAPSTSVNIGSSSQVTAAFNITNIVKGWKSNPSYESKGILIKNANESSNTYTKILRSTESTSTPYISVTYTIMGKSARILYDSSCPYSASELNNYYSSAVGAFTTEFFIRFNRNSTSYLSSLTGASCPNTDKSSICTEDCGGLSNCNKLHHKSSQRLLNVEQSSSYYTYRLVGHALCYYENGQHKGVVGLGNVNGKNAITSVTSSPDIARSIQHELTHNLGGSHNTCDANSQRCVLKGDKDYWCDTCRANILKYR